MICPKCRTENEMAFSALSHGFVCLEENCGFEVEVDPEAFLALEPVSELVCA
jgi:hypothetical protein